MLAKSIPKIGRLSGEFSEGRTYRVYTTRPLEGEFAGKAREELSIDEFHLNLGMFHMNVLGCW